MKKILIVSIVFFWSYKIYSQELRHEMSILSDVYKYNVIRDKEPDPSSPNKKGWYYSQAGVVATPTGYVACFRRSDFHTANITDIMVAYSPDGKMWSGHHSIAHADVWNEQGVWVAPQLTKLGDGRLVIICDFGKRTSGQDWPMLSDWQKSNRGMFNYLFWSEDDGKTWTGPVKADDVGGEPGYITELDDETLIYTRTISDKTNKLWSPPQPWGNIYYKSESIHSEDGGESWKEAVTLADSPFHGDCEVGIVEYAPEKLLAVTRIGHGGGQFIQPSRFVYSNDGGKSWTNPVLSPVYGQRPIVHKLQSGKLLAVYRNSWGTPGTYAFLFSPDEKFEYQPATFLYDESRCRLNKDFLTINTGENITSLVIFGFYPAQSPHSKVVIEAELKVEEADLDGCNISAGCWIRFLADRVCLADQPETGFDINAKEWHVYKIVRSTGIISIYVDGKLKLKASVDGLENKLVQVGNRMVKGFNFNSIENDKSSGLHTKSTTHWRRLHVFVDNEKDYDIDWQWDTSKGYPDQFKRDRIIALDIIAATASHCGYSGFTQQKDGTIVIVDYTVGGNGKTPDPMPYIRSYVVNEEILTVTK